MSRPRVAALLFGRGGSVALPGKNIKRILGRPSLHYPLLAASAVRGEIIDAIYVSSDSDAIFDLARPMGIAEIRRPARLASNEALLEDAIVHAFETVDAAAQPPFDLFLILLCNSVTVLPDRIKEAYAILCADPSADSVTTVSKWNMFSPIRARRVDRLRATLDHYIPMSVLGGIVNVSCDRDKSEDCYFCDNSFTLVRRDALRRLHQNNGPFKWMGNTIRILEQLPGGGDVDVAWQVPVVEWWLREHGFTETTLPYATTSSSTVSSEARS